jgi:hypothetical protein
MAHDDRRAIIRAYDRIAGEYLDQFGAPPSGVGDQEFIKQSLALMGAGPVLDVGCGPRLLARLVRRAGFDVESFRWRDPAADEFQAEHGFLRARAR